MKTVVLFLFMVAIAQAATNIGPICFTINGADDTFRIEADWNDDASTPMFPVPAVNWFGPPDVYQMGGSGSANISRVAGGIGKFALDVTMPQRSGFWFNGQPICALVATLEPILIEPEPLAGPFTMTCFGKPTVINFVKSGTMAEVDCAPPEAIISNFRAGPEKGLFGR